MRTFNQAQKELLIHLLKGGTVKETGDMFAQTTTVLEELKLTNGVSLSISLLLEDYVIHFSDEELRIQELEELLNIQSEQLQKALAKNKELKPSKRRRAHLTKQEVIAIEKDIEAEGDAELIQKAHDISPATYSRILHMYIRIQLL